MLASPTAPGVARTLLPGQLESERYTDAERTGVILDASVLSALKGTAQDLGVALSEPATTAPANA